MRPTQGTTRASTKDINKVVNQLQKANSNLCDLIDVTSGTVDPPIVVTTSGTADDTLNSGATASLTLNHVVGDNIRHVMITSSSTDKVTIAVTQSDANVINHVMYGGSYNLELAMDQYPVTSVVVTATAANDTNVVINTLSKTL